VLDMGSVKHGLQHFRWLNELGSWIT